MKATGITRRIDDLGRVVIPKEIRRSLRIREGDAFDLFIGENGEVIYKKHVFTDDISTELVHVISALRSQFNGIMFMAFDQDAMPISRGCRAPAEDTELVHQALSYRRIQENENDTVIRMAIPILVDGEPWACLFASCEKPTSTNLESLRTSMRAFAQFLTATAES